MRVISNVLLHVMCIPAWANIEREQIFYKSIHPHIEARIPTVAALDMQDIEQIRPGGLLAYFKKIQSLWHKNLSAGEGEYIEEATKQVFVIDSDKDPRATGNAFQNKWGQIYIVLPKHLQRKSIYYYFLLSHELEYARQHHAVFEAFDSHLDEQYGKGDFWLKFERELSAMTLEWFFLHHLPKWGRDLFESELSGLIFQNRQAVAAFNSLKNSAMDLNSYLNSQWESGRNSWSALYANCELLLDGEDDDTKLKISGR